MVPDHAGDGEGTRIRAAAVIVAGGTGVRFGDSGGKQLASVLGVPLLARSVSPFNEAESVSEIVLVCHPDRVEEYEAAVRENLELSVPLVSVAGGETRQESVGRGLAATSDLVEMIVVHDGARPLISAALVDAVISALRDDSATDGLVVGHPAYDTLKRVREDHIIETPDRSEFWIAATPQVFRADALRSAYRQAEERGISGTDDASLVESAQGRVRMFEGPRENIKVTVGEDLATVEAILVSRENRDG